MSEETSDPGFASSEATATSAGGAASSERYPRGWYFVAYSEALKAKQVRKVRLFGVDWALFRTRTGRAAVIEAYCTHLGADLGLTGVVKGEHLQCPFHAWEYSCEGACVVAPRVERIPKAARQFALATEEHLGCVFVWYGEGAPEAFPRFGESADPELYMRPPGEVHEGVGDPRTIMEHTSDSYHFKHAHQIGVTFDWEAIADTGLDYAFYWKIGEDQKAHPAFEWVRQRGLVSFAGPCTAVYRVIDPKDVSGEHPRVSIVLTVTPIEVGRTLLSMRILLRKPSKKLWGAPLNAVALALGWGYFTWNVHQDLHVLKTTRRCDRPVWVKADGESIRRYRAYYDRNLIATPRQWAGPTSRRSVPSEVPGTSQA